MKCLYCGQTPHQTLADCPAVEYALTNGSSGHTSHKPAGTGLCSVKNCRAKRLPHGSKCTKHQKEYASKRYRDSKNSHILLLT